MRYLLLPLVFLVQNSVASDFFPEVEEELLATLLIRKLFKNEETYRYFLPYDRALVKSVAPHALRLAFHMNMDKSDGCIDMTNSFSNGLQNFTTKVEENHNLYKKIFRVLQEVSNVENTGKLLNGTEIDEINFTNLFKVRERECNRNSNFPNILKCAQACRELIDQNTTACRGKLVAWQKSGFIDYLSERFESAEFVKTGFLIDADTQENNYDRIFGTSGLVETLWRFYANVLRYENNTFNKPESNPKINLADFYNMVFVEAMHSVMPYDFKSQCKGMRARELVKKESDKNYLQSWIPGFSDRKHNDCYEVGIPKRNAEFLVTYTREMPERPWFTYGRTYVGKCEDENNCACKMEVEDTPDPRKLFDYNFEKMSERFPGLNKQDYALLLSAHAVGGIHKPHSGFSTGPWTPGQSNDLLDTDFIHRITKWGYHWRQAEVIDNDGSTKFEFHSVENREDCEATIECDICDQQCVEECEYNFDPSYPVEEFFYPDGSPKSCTLNGTFQNPRGYLQCPPPICFGDGYPAKLSQVEFNWKKWDQIRNFTKISLPVDIATSRNVTMNPTTFQVMSSGAKNGPVGVARDEWYREDMVPDIMFKYFNHRKNKFDDNSHSRTGVPYNVQDPAYNHRRQNFSAEYQFDFWLSYDKMIMNGYQGGFGTESNKTKLYSTKDNFYKLQNLCMKSGLDIAWSGNINFYDGWVTEFCNVAALENATFYDDEGNYHPETISSEFISIYTGKITEKSRNN